VQKKIGAETAELRFVLDCLRSAVARSCLGDYHRETTECVREALSEERKTIRSLCEGTHFDKVVSYPDFFGVFYYYQKFNWKYAPLCHCGYG